LAVAKALRTMGGFVAVIGILYSSTARGVELRNWRSSPYRIQAFLAVDASWRPQPQLEQAIALHIRERVDATLAPIWSFKLTEATDAATRRQCFDPVENPWDDIPDPLRAFDKLLWLSVKATPAGYEIRCREFDLFLRRWGARHELTVSQRSFLQEASFQALKDAFSPLAIIETIPENEDQVQLILKGNDLRRSSVDTPIASGEAFLPVWRRTDRAGALVENGVQPVPWTLLTGATKNEDGWIADIHTGIRRAFGGRRSALIDQVAVALRLPVGPTRVRFHARSDAKQGLGGYEVFRSTADGGSEPVGLTDSDGVISVPPGPGAVSTLLLRSEGQVLARLPIAAGGSDLVQAPIADDSTRLQALAEARVVREELIDVVARRAILMARTRALLKAGRIEDAQKALQELDSLPSSSAFNRNLDAIAKRIPDSSDPQVEKTIDKLLSTTRELLGKFLSTRPVLDLQSEVNAAARNSS
jgi:hypothetical protein